jgi:hypothetical protein
MPRRFFLLAVLCLAAPALAAPVFAAARETTQVDTGDAARALGLPAGFTVRARVAKMTPDGPADIAWRWGGEGLGGTVARGTLGQGLAVGEWTLPAEAASFVERKPPDPFFLTIVAGRQAKDARGRAVVDSNVAVEIEFEFAWRGKTVKRLTEAGPDGGTVGLVIPTGRLAGGKAPDDAAFLDGLVGIYEYARRRTESLEALPWAAQSVPKKLLLVTDVGGYGAGAGYGVRHTDKRVVELEARALRQLGVNSLRAAPDFLLPMAARGEGFAAGLGRAHIGGAMSYPVPAYREGRQNDPEAGCPFGSGVAEATKAGVAAAVEQMAATGFPEVWGLTDDEIGTVVDRSADGKSHYARCPRCAAAFREHLRGQGLKPADFGAKTWDDVRPVDIGAKDGPGFDMADPGARLAAYWTRMFNNWASAHLFTPLRDACRAANDAKRRALAEGRADAPEARRPWLYSYALRGNTFLMKGHSLDFFDFYRHADNAFVYETSNRAPQVWQWDGYLCDVGRTVSREQGLQFGVYVKPHRGAPVQRALAAAARGARLIYWYTYGPDYKKGDSFSQHPEAMALVSRAARLLARGEDVLAGGAWPEAPRVAVVKPRTSEIWMGFSADPAYPASWENAKWTWTALAHSHVPVAAIDEAALAEGDLARFKVIYVLGPNVTRAAAAGLARWVASGGVLVTSPGGLARDEADRPLDSLAPVLGLAERKPVEMYRRIALYGAGAVQPFDDARDVLAPVPEGAAVRLDGAAEARRLVVGRETLSPAESTEVLARFADGTPAVTRRAHGKGAAVVMAYFAGLEYSAPVRGKAYNMARDFDPALARAVAAPALAAVRPAVETSQPLVEGILVRHPEMGGRAVVLMNWAYETAEGGPNGVRHVPLADVRVTVRGAGEASRASSAWTGEALPVVRQGDAIMLTMPQVNEGDVLLLE